MFMIGVSTLQVDLNSDSATVLSLQQSIHELSDLLPSQQECDLFSQDLPDASLIYSHSKVWVST